MVNLVPIFIVGFIILGAYKVFELFVKKKEWTLFIEKLASLYENEEDKEKRLKFQLPVFEMNDYSSWPLRIALLLAGIGAGCLVAFFIQIIYFNDFHTQSFQDWSNQFRDLILLINFASISLLGGIGLLIAYLIEQKKKK